MRPPANPNQEITPKNLQTKKNLKKNLKIKDKTVLDDKAARPVPEQKHYDSPEHTPYQYRASVGKMPADPMQKAINDKPPVAEPDMLRKNWTSNDHIKNAKAIDKHKTELQTKEQRNLKQVIGVQEGDGGPPPPIIKNDYNRE